MRTVAAAECEGKGGRLNPPPTPLQWWWGGWRRLSAESARGAYTARSRFPVNREGHHGPFPLLQDTPCYTTRSKNDSENRKSTTLMCCCLGRGARGRGASPRREGAAGRRRRRWRRSQRPRCLGRLCVRRPCARRRGASACTCGSPWPGLRARPGGRPTAPQRSKCDWQEGLRQCVADWVRRRRRAMEVIAH